MPQIKIKRVYDDPEKSEVSDTGRPARPEELKKELAICEWAKETPLPKA